MKYIDIMMISILSLLIISCGSQVSSDSHTTNVYYGTAQGVVKNLNVIVPGHAVINSIDGSPIQNIAQDNQNNLYTITYAGNVWEYSNNAWIKVGESSLGARLFFKRMAIDAYNNIYAINNQGQVYIKTPNSTDWQPFGSTLPDSTDNYVFTIYAHNDRIYIGTQYLVYSATFESPVWNKVGNNAIPGESDAAIENIIYDDVKDKLYAEMLFGGVYGIESNSQSWTSVAGIVPNGGAGTAMASDERGSIYVANVDNDNPLDSGLVYVSLYGEESWVLVNNGQENLGISTLAMSSDNVLYAGTFMPFYLDNQNFIPIACGLGVACSIDGSDVASILPTEGGLFIGTYMGDVVVQNGTGWKFLNSQTAGALDSSQVIALTTNSQGEIYAATARGNVWYYHNKNWQQVANSSAGSGKITLNALSVAVDNQNSVYITNYDGRVYYSYQGKSSWQKLGGETVPYVIQDVAALTHSKNTVYMLGFESGSNNVYAYDLKNNLWNKVTTLVPNYPGHPFAYIISDQVNNIYASNYEPGGLWEKAVNQSAWQALSMIPDGSGVTSMTTNNTNLLYVGSEKGQVYINNKSGWQLIGPKLNGAIIAIALDKNNTPVVLSNFNGNYIGYKLDNTTNTWKQIFVSTSLVNHLIVN